VSAFFTTTMKLNFKKLHPRAETPAYASAGAANMDISALIEDDLHGEGPVSVRPGGQVIVRTGLAFEVPDGWVLAIYSRSGHGFKAEVCLSNGTGQIDSDYRGEVKVALKNHGKARFTVRHGDRIAQFRLEPAPRFELVEVAGDLTDTARGAGGFGSTGSA
jgi:dUTP pyrophosphatase